jgi:hypothetical protein
VADTIDFAANNLKTSSSLFFPFSFFLSSFAFSLVKYSYALMPLVALLACAQEL